MLQDIRARLAYNHISQTALAKSAIGCQQSSLSQWLTGAISLPDGMEAHIGHTITRLEKAESRSPRGQSAVAGRKRCGGHP